MKCPSCNQRKGKRDCPGLRQTICSTCCGEKRIVEIPCPADCPYLLSGQEYQGSRHFGKQMQGPDRDLYGQVLSHSASVLMALFNVLVAFRRTVRSFADRDALEAVQVVRKTCETEYKGIIYEHSSPDPIAQAAVRDLRQRIGELRKSREDGAEPVKLGEILKCLEVLEKELSAEVARGESPTAYMDFINGFFPAAARPAPSIILP